MAAGVGFDRRKGKRVEQRWRASNLLAVVAVRDRGTAAGVVVAAAGAVVGGRLEGTEKVHGRLGAKSAGEELKKWRKVNPLRGL